jgi:ketosteroid isomerase-like protein
MNKLESAHVQLVREYIDALQSGSPSDALRRFFTPDVLQVDLPNRFNPNGNESNLEALLQRVEQARKLTRDQRYKMQSCVEQDHRIAVEALWSGTLNSPLGTIVAGTTLRGHFAMFFEMQDGKIFRQRNYDCFEPW